MCDYLSSNRHRKSQRATCAEACMINKALEYPTKTSQSYPGFFIDVFLPSLSAPKRLNSLPIKCVNGINPKVKKPLYHGVLAALASEKGPSDTLSLKSLFHPVIDRLPTLPKPPCLGSLLALLAASSMIWFRLPERLCCFFCSLLICRP